MACCNNNVGATEMLSLFVGGRGEKIVFILKKVMLC